MVHILDIFVSIAMSTILFLAGCSDKAVKDNEGNASFTIIDFNRERDVQVQMSTRSINSNVYGQLANSFDKMVGQFDTKKIED